MRSKRDSRRATERHDPPGWVHPASDCYVIGNRNQVSWSTQARVDNISEMGNRRLWHTTTGGGYTDSQPEG